MYLLVKNILIKCNAVLKPAFFFIHIHFLFIDTISCCNHIPIVLQVMTEIIVELLELSRKIYMKLISKNM